MAFNFVSLFLGTNLSIDVVIHSCSYEKDLIQVKKSGRAPSNVWQAENQLLHYTSLHRFDIVLPKRKGRTHPPLYCSSLQWY